MGFSKQKFCQQFPRLLAEVFVLYRSEKSERVERIPIQPYLHALEFETHGLIKLLEVVFVGFSGRVSTTCFSLLRGGSMFPQDRSMAGAGEDNVSRFFRHVRLYFCHTRFASTTRQIAATGNPSIFFNRLAAIDTSDNHDCCLLSKKTPDACLGRGRSRRRSFAGRGLVECGAQFT